MRSGRAYVERVVIDDGAERWRCNFYGKIKLSELASDHNEPHSYRVASYHINLCTFPGSCGHAKPHSRKM